jgi:hypothetical protein
MQAHVLSENAFKMPKVFESSDAAYIHIIYIIYLEPGKFQSHPTMGVGIRSKYRYNNDENMLQDLKSDIKYQIEHFLPELEPIDITVGVLKNHSLGIIINTGDGAYTLEYDQDNDNMSAGATYILDQLLN